MEPRPVANHSRYQGSTCILCVLRTLLVPLSGSREPGDSVAISGRPLNTEMSLPRASRTGRTRSSGRAPTMVGKREEKRRTNAERIRTKENGRERRREPGQTGPRLTEVAPGPQTINKERSNLWTGLLISTLLLFSHLIDGLLHRFVLSPFPASCSFSAILAPCSLSVFLFPSRN